MPQEYFDTDEHALHTGMMIGFLMSKGVPVTPETDGEGNYTGLLRVVMSVPDDPVKIIAYIRVLPPQL